MTDSNEDLLRALGRHARERRASEPAPAVAPLGPEQREAIAARLIVLLEPRAATLDASATAPPKRPGPLRLVPPLRVLPLVRRWTLPLCAAAAIALWIARPEPISPLTRYSLELVATGADARGGETAAQAGTVQLRAGTVTTLMLRPDTQVTGAVDARAFLARGAALTPLALKVIPSASGALQLRLEAPSLPHDAGALIVVVGWRPILADRAEALARSPEPRGDGYQRWSLPVRAGP